MITLISVTWDDIEVGEVANCLHCPQALAIQRKLHPRVGISVDVGSASLWDSVSGKRTTLLLPLEAREFITAFDGDEPPQEWGIPPSELSRWQAATVEPMTYTLDIPEEFLLGGPHAEAE